ncbi:hypothetical protein SRHO_G00317680 [Serrasalmus rhombeus]
MSIRKYSRVASRRLRPVMADHENHSGGDTQQERQIRMDTIHKWTWQDSLWTVNSLTLGKQRMPSLLALDLINGLEMVLAASGWTVGGCLPMRDRSISFPQRFASMSRLVRGCVRRSSRCTRKRKVGSHRRNYFTVALEEVWI